MPLGLIMPLAMLFERLSGVGWTEIGRYWGLFAFHVTGPGVLLFRMARRPEDAHWLSDLSFGTSVGCALLTASFLCARRLHLPFYPTHLCVSVLSCGALIFTRKPGASQEAHRILSLKNQARLLALYVFIVVVVVLKHHSINPLPGSVPSAAYFHDYMWHLAIVGEALHRWPLRDMQCASLPLIYHSFSHMAMAAAIILTGQETTLVFFRLFNGPFLLALLFQLYFLGRWLLGSQEIGVAAALLFLVVTEAIGARGNLFTYILHDKLSDTGFLLGLGYMSAWLYFAGEILRAGSLSLLGTAVFYLLTAVATGTKTPLMPVLLSGLFGTLVWRRVINGRLDRAAAMIAIGSALVFFITLALLIDRNSLRNDGDWLRFLPLAHERSSVFWRAAYPRVSMIPGIGVFLFILCQIGTSGLRLWGSFIFLNRKRLDRLKPNAVLLAMTGAAGLAAGSLIRGRFGEEIYFVHYGSLPLALTGGAGLVLFLRTPSRYRSRLFSIMTLILALGASSKVLMNVAGAYRWISGRVVYRSGPVVLTRQAYEAYCWVKTHTESDAVLASWPSAVIDFQVAALTERRVVLGGWYYQSDVLFGNAAPELERHEALRKAFSRGTSDALLRLKDAYGARYLIWDRKEWPAIPDRNVAKLIFQNATISVYKIVSPGA